MKMLSIGFLSNRKKAYHKFVDKLTFVKLCNKWYIDLPSYEGELSELQMIAGADNLLQEIANKSDKTNQVTIGIVENKKESDIQLNLVELAQYGGTYKVHSTENQFETKQLWLCNVTKFVFGDHPEEILVKIIW